MNALYSPLSGKYCDYFYYLAVIMFVMFVFVFVGAFQRLLSKSGPTSTRNMLIGIAGVAAVSLPVFLGYFQSRLFYSVCAASLR